ncbi:hypothetical protein ACFL6M_00570 [Candidatus Eisenbacteria bacterium]|uniref:FlgD Ig-like domain-containing protein n=1 Tax=Eiseniibacteriota bacterium TaxID=2212470 RepID=A0ABV6YIG3_UNCEI
MQALRLLSILLTCGALWSVCFVGGPALAQSFDPVWADGYGDTADQHVMGVAIDYLGATVITGHFEGNIDFGGGALYNAGGRDIFVARFAADGTHLWSHSYGSTGDQIAMDVTVDNQANVYVVGHYQNSVDFGGGPLTSVGDSDAFLVKLNAGGTHNWSHSFGDVDNQVARAVAADNSGKVYVTGYFKETIDFGGGPLTSAGGFDVFLVQFTRGTGTHMWSNRFGDASTQIGVGIAKHDLGFVAITGQAAGTIDFGGGPLTSAGGSDVFVAEFDTFNHHLWSDLYGDATDLQEGIEIAIDPHYRDIVVTGRFFGTLNFGGGPLVSMGDFDTFLVKFDDTGSHLWSRRYGGTQGTLPGGMHVRPFGAVALTGYFEGSAQFGGNVLTSAGGRDAYVALYDAEGFHTLSQRYGDAANQAGEDIVFDDSGEIIVTGDFRGSIDFGDGPLTSAGVYDVFLTKLGMPDSRIGEATAGIVPLLNLAPLQVNQRTTLCYSLPRAGWVRLSLHDIEGRQVEMILDRYVDAGSHSLNWSSNDAVSGVRYILMNVDGFRRVGKTVFVE